MSSAPNSAEVRAHIAKALNLIVEKNRTIDWILAERGELVSTPLEKELLYGCARHYYHLQSQVDNLLKKPLRGKDLDLYHLMLVGAYQLHNLDIPIHAAINETVAATVTLRKPWARGLVNGVMRNLERNISNPINYERSFGQPQWLFESVQADYPDKFAAILSANNTRAPMVLRINPLKTSIEGYCQLLETMGLSFEIGLLPESVILETPTPSNNLPGWLEGKVAVQDMGAQFAAHLLHKYVSEKAITLDACAAPGGKLAHLLELMSQTPGNDQPAITAIDISPARIDQTQQILARLGHKVGIKLGDAAALDWWDNRAFDAILLDAPCSGTGTLRRHPDIKLLLNPQDISEHAANQTMILNNLWQTLAPGGTLLYCTCSLLAAENDKVIRPFLEQHSDACSLDISLPTGTKTDYGWQLLPTDPSTDGFYYALLHKAPAVE